MVVDAAGNAAPPTLIFATRNPGKVIEMNALLEGASWAVGSMPADIPEYEEVGETFADNARGKALFTAERLSVPVLADDSGLEVEALGGEPGVRSARYIDPAITQDERNRALLAKLADVSPEGRGARFVCHLALAFGGEVVHETTGSCGGRITTAPRGSGGFGYDPVFLRPELGRTFAELSREEKSALSHRGAAARRMAEFLRRWRPA